MVSHSGMSFSSLCIAMSLASFLISGCAAPGSSRWAMDHPDYAAKYQHAYPGNDGEKMARMLKQSVDARYVDGHGGCYAGVAAAGDPISIGGEIGKFHYINSTLEGRIGVRGLAGTGAEDYFLGGDAGLRIQTPSRLAPFAGIGAYVGGNSREVLATNDNIDNDNDGLTDEFNEKDDVSSFFSSVYPEVGVHFWLNGTTRLTGSAQYHVTTEGRDADFWFVGVSLAFLNDDTPGEFTGEFKPLDRE